MNGAGFRKELTLPERGHIGRYDGRYRASDANAIAPRPAFDPSNPQISPALNQGYLWYVHHVQKWKTDRACIGLNVDAFTHRDRKHKAPDRRDHSNCRLKADAHGATTEQQQDSR